MGAHNSAGVIREQRPGGGKHEPDSPSPTDRPTAEGADSRAEEACKSHGADITARLDPADPAARPGGGIRRDTIDPVHYVGVPALGTVEALLGSWFRFDTEPVDVSVDGVVVPVEDQVRSARGYVGIVVVLARLLGIQRAVVGIRSNTVISAIPFWSPSPGSAARLLSGPLRLMAQSPIFLVCTVRISSRRRWVP